MLQFLIPYAVIVTAKILRFQAAVYQTSTILIELKLNLVLTKLRDGDWD